MSIVIVDGDHITVQIIEEVIETITGPAPIFEGEAGGTWGSITGTLSNQSDLQAALNAKQAAGNYALAGHSHIIADVNLLQAALDSKQPAGTYASAVHGHDIEDVAGLQSALDGKQGVGNYAEADHGHVIADVTGLATAISDLETGKQDAGNYAAAGHSHIIDDVSGLQAALDAKADDGAFAAADHDHIIDDVTGLQDALDGKQAAGSYAAATHSHIITDVTGLEAALDSRDIYFNIINAIGTDALGETITKFWEVSQGLVLGDAVARYFPLWVKAAGTITSFRWWQHVVGSYTPDAENSISIFTYSAGTITRIGGTGNVANLWQTGSSASARTENLSTPVSVSKGLHWAGILYNQSAVTTAPQIGINTNMLIANLSSIGLSNSAKISGNVNATSAIPSSLAMSAISTNNANIWMQVL